MEKLGEPTIIKRRTFVKVGTVGFAVIGARKATHAENHANANNNKTDKRTYRESAKDIPIVDEADVVVCGGGPAGIAAAIAAARTGAKTQLLEVGGCLGGVWTAGLLCWILDTKDKPGLLLEIMQELKNRNAGYLNPSTYAPFAYDAEIMKLLLEEMCVDAGSRVRLHTRVVSTATDGDNRLRLAITESKSGREAWAGKIFIDATGDGDLAAQAGCGFDFGRPEDRKTQPMSMMALLTGLNQENIPDFVRGSEKNSSITKKRLLAEIEKAGYTPSYTRPTLFRIYDDLFLLAGNHEYEYSAIDADDVTQATIHSRAEVHKIVDALRSLGGRWQNVRIVATNEHIGIREGRRIHGLYTVTTEDLIEGIRHDDSVCRTYFCVDVHSVQESEGGHYTSTGVRSKPYDIPLRALIAKDVNGLLVAGRCISGDFISHSSYRVTGNSVAMGQAAGVAAALAAQKNCLPQEIPWAQMKPAIAKLG